jgi:hypothetical protein
MLLLQTLAVEQQGENAPSGLELVIQIVTVGTAIIGLAKAFIDFLQGRVRRKPLSDSRFKAIGLRTGSRQWWGGIAIRGQRFTARVTIVAGILFIVFLPFGVASLEEPDLVFIGFLYLGMIEGFTFIAIGAHDLMQLRGKVDGQPIVRHKVALILEAQTSEVLARCQQTLNALGAFTVEESYIKHCGDIRRIQGGVRGWPPKGHRIVIKLRPWKEDCCFVVIESASLVTGIFQNRRNTRVIRELLTNLL